MGESCSATGDGAGCCAGLERPVEISGYRAGGGAEAVDGSAAGPEGGRPELGGQLIAGLTGVGTAEVGLTTARLVAIGRSAAVRRRLGLGPTRPAPRVRASRERSRTCPRGSPSSKASTRTRGTAL